MRDGVQKGLLATGGWHSGVRGCAVDRYINHAHKLMAVGDDSDVNVAISTNYGW